MHVLFVLDDLSLTKGGVYSLEVGLIDLLQRIKGTNIKISCTTCEEKSSVVRGISLIQLSNDDLKCGRIKSEDTEGVTYIFLFASHTIDCALEGGIVRTVKNRNQDVKVIIINNDYKRVQEILPKIPEDIIVLMFALTQTCHDNSKNIHLTRTDGQYCKEFYPHLKEIRCRMKEAPKPPVRTIITFVTNTFMSGSGGTGWPLLRLCGDTITSLKHNLEKGEQKFEFQWKIYCQNDSIKEDIYKQISELPYQDCTTVNVLQSSDEESFKSDMALANLCVASGTFDSHMYCGLETLLSGIPTVVLRGSDVAEILKKVSFAHSKYFVLDDNAKKEGWLITFQDILSNDRIIPAFLEAKRFIDVYYNWPSVKGSLEELLKQFTKNKPLKDVIDNIQSPLDIDDQPLVDPDIQSQSVNNSAHDDYITLGIEIRKQHNGNNDDEETPLKREYNAEETSLKTLVRGENVTNSAEKETSLKTPTSNIQCDGPLPTTQFDYSPQNCEQPLSNIRFDGPVVVNSNDVFSQLGKTVSQLSPTSPESPVFKPLWPGTNLHTQPSNVLMDDCQGAYFIRPTTTVTTPSIKYETVNRKNFKSLSDSEESSSDDSGPGLPRVSTPPPKTKSRHKQSSSLFTTSKSAKSPLSKKIDKIKKAAQKPVKKK